jgi:acyl-CoA dehydrogenase
MTIDFETPKPIAQMQAMLKTVAENMMRSTSREFDENEHAIPWDYVEFMHTAMRSMGGGGGLTVTEDKPKEGAEKRPPIGYQKLAAQIEMLAWGDVGYYLITPGGGLGAAAVQAAGSPEQKAKFLARFNDDKPTYAAMCMTEPGAGSDTSAIPRARCVG